MWRRWRLLTATLRLALFLALAGALGFGLSADAWARQGGQGGAIPSVEFVKLPPEAQTTLQLIQRGGPFPFPHKDGSLFGNYEKRLPDQFYGYYREYTVPTPGRRDRGARRMIAGRGATGNVATSGEYYYTEDHYRHFFRVLP